MMQIVSLAFTAKKTWINPGSLTPATGVPAIQPCFNDLHSIPWLKGLDTSQALGKLQKFPGNDVRIEHIIEPALHMRSQVKVEFALHVLIVNQFLQTFKVLYEITPGADGSIFIKNQKFVVDKGTSFTPMFGEGEAIEGVPKVQYKRLGVPVVRAKFSLRQQNPNIQFKY